ncbi:hypothetical protein Tco_1450611 [Tanacetum coccineum]
MLEPVKVKYIFLGYHESIVGNKLWRLDDVTSNVVLYRNIGFNESGKYKKTFIGSGVVTGSVQVLQGVDYREDSNEAAFAVVAVDKIYTPESLTFNDTVSCEVISKWKAGLKEDMDVQSDVCKAEIWVTKGLLVKAKGNVLGVEIIRDQSVGSHEYQMVCTSHDIVSIGVDMLDGFDRGLQTNVQGFVDFDYAMGRSITHMEALSTTVAGYMTFIEACKKEIWLKRPLTESGYELRLVAGIATGALVKGYSRSEVLAQVKVAAYRY